MNIFPLRRRDALSELKLPDGVFGSEDEGDDDSFAADEADELREPVDYTPVSPANELATALVERDIAQAVQADNPAPTPSMPIEMPAPLSQRHLETIDRMVAHLKADEQRLEKQISDARRQLADTQLARHGYERTSAELRRGIAVLIRLASTKPAAPRPRARRSVPADLPPVNGSGMAEADRITVLKPRGRRKMH
jgi:hypothetical protein